jgi:RimJ/RimL family protein N-acetyltransferase
MRQHDLTHVVRWFSDPEIRHWFHSSETGPESLEALEAAFRQLGEDRADFMIESLEGRVLGNTNLYNINQLHGRAELYVCIGEKDAWNQGYGTDAIKTLLRFAFAELDLRRVELITDADNLRGIRCYEKCGFIREGVLRERRLRYGQPIDMLGMSVLKA